MVKASTQTITRFLIDFKKALSHGDWEIVERRADYAQMTEMPAKAIKIVLLGLTPRIMCGDRKLTAMVRVNMFGCF